MINLSSSEQHKCFNRFIMKHNNETLNSFDPYFQLPIDRFDVTMEHLKHIISQMQCSDVTSCI